MKTPKFPIILLASFTLVVGLSIVSVKPARTSNYFHENQAHTNVIYIPIIYHKAPQASGCLPNPPLQPDDLDNENSIASGLTSERVNSGHNPLTIADELTQAARRHSRDMADNDFTSHTGSNGSTPDQRIEQACYTWTAWGEIIGWGFDGDPSRMIHAWMDSPPHKGLILSETFDDFGVGYAESTGSEWSHYWTVDFGKRGEAVDTSKENNVFVCTYALQGEDGGGLLTIHSSAPCR